MEDLCPCGSNKSYTECCQPLIGGDKQAQTAEALMRARYSAHVKAQVDYIYDTTHPDKRDKVDRKQVTAWAKNSEWLGLQINATQDGGPEDDQGTVEFTARYREKEKTMEHREIAEFVRKDGLWYFLDGNPPKPVQSIRKGPKIGRNNPCPCGSGKKYKKCCYQ
ncbi:MAG: YchJ family protein [Desulfobacteraceae bacterium]|jgi:SEC-C motif-containing protein